MIKIWGRNTSANVVKVLWLCGEIGLPFERIDVGGAFGGLQEPEFLELNPNGAIPVVEDDHTVIWESHAILRYLAARYGQETLYPAESAARSHVDRWLDWHIGTMSPAITPVFIALYRTPEAERNADEFNRALAKLTTTFVWLDRQLAERPYIAGDTFTIADVAFGNSVWRWFSFPFSRPALPHLEAWQARVALRPGYKTHIAQPLS